MDVDPPMAWYGPQHVALREVILPAGLNYHFDKEECTVRIATTAGLRKGSGETCSEYSSCSSWTCRRIKDEI